MQNELERKIMITVLKEIKQLLEEILAELKKQKEPTAVTVDSGKIVLGNWTKEQIDSTKQI